MAGARPGGRGRPAPRPALAARRAGPRRRGARDARHRRDALPRTRPADRPESLATELPADALAHLDGDSLVHLDLRADNLLISGGRAVLLDWPHACSGPAWLDLLALLFEVDRLGGEDLAEEVLRTSTLTRDVDPHVLTTVLAGFAVFFLTRAGEPDPPGLPTLRAFQRAQGEALQHWVARRRG